MFSVRDLVLDKFAGKKFWNLFHLQPMRDQKVVMRCVLFLFINVLNEL